MEVPDCLPPLLPMSPTAAQQQQQQQRESRPRAESNDVLQFLLGAAPLNSKSLSSMSPSTSVDSQQQTAPALTMSEDLESVALLEYTSDVESDDDYLGGCELAGSSMGDLWRRAEAETLEERRELIPCDENFASTLVPIGKLSESVARGALRLSPVLEELEEMVAEKTGGSQCASDSFRNDTDSDGVSSESDIEVCGPCEVEEAPAKLSGASARMARENVALSEAKAKVEDRNASASEILGRHDKDGREKHGRSDIRTPSRTSNDTVVLSHMEKTHKNGISKSEGTLPIEATKCFEKHKSVGSLELLGSHNARRPIEKNHRLDPLSPTRAEFLFVGAVTTAISLYVVATIYAYFHPIFLPLPSLLSLQSPANLSKVGISISQPANHSLMPQPLFLEWTLTNYPADVIETFGPEVFQYRIFVNGKQVMSEIGILNDDEHSASASSSMNDHTEPVTVRDKPVSFVNKTMRQRIPSHFVSEFMSYEILLEITLLVPGSEDAMMTMKERVFVVNAVEVTRRLDMIAPKSGSVFSKDEPVVVRYTIAHVLRIDVILDGTLLVAKRHIDDGTLLLRGLSAGQHTIALVGYDAAGERIPSKQDGDTATTIEIVD